MEIKTALGLICFAVVLINLHKIMVMKELKFMYVIPLAISDFLLAYVGANLLFD